MSGCVHVVLEEFLNSFFDILVPRPKISGDFNWLIGHFAKRDPKAVGRDNHRKHPFQGSDSDPPTVNELNLAPVLGRPGTGARFDGVEHAPAPKTRRSGVALLRMCPKEVEAPARAF